MFGEPGIIHCSALGNPAPQFQWSREDGGSLSGFIQLTSGSLKVESIREEDNGTYICTIKQSRGFDSISEKSQSIIVIVIGKMRKKNIHLDVLYLNHQHNQQSVTAFG